ASPLSLHDALPICVQRRQARVLEVEHAQGEGPILWHRCKRLRRLRDHDSRNGNLWLGGAHRLGGQSVRAHRREEDSGCEAKHGRSEERRVGKEGRSTEWPEKCMPTIEI